MQLSITAILAVSVLLLSGCGNKPGQTGAGSERTVIQSAFTNLSPDSCRAETDKSDPNETPFLVCPGPAEHALIVRRVDAGRRSVDVVDPQGRTHPLRYQEVVTRHMFTLDHRAEWRVAHTDGKQVPVALIVRVRAHEDNEHPETATRSYLAVAKIAPDEVCVTDIIPEETDSEAKVQSAADSARERTCAPPRPHLTEGGVTIR